MVHADASIFSIEWAFILVIIMFFYLLLLFNNNDKKEPKTTNDKRIKEILEKGGYVVKAEDDSGNLMFEKVCHVSKSSFEKGKS